MNKPINSDDAQYSRSDVDTIGAHRQSSATGIRYADAPGTIRVSATQSLENAATLWRVFERRAISTPFQTFAWLEAWQSHIGSAQGVTPHIVFGHDQSDGLCLIMPLAISLRRGVRTLSWLGDGLAALQAPIVRPEITSQTNPAALERFWQAALESAGDIDVVHLSNQPKRIGQHPNPLRSSRFGMIRSAGCALSLPGRWSEFVDKQMSPQAREQSSHDDALLRRNGQIDLRLDLPIDDRKSAVERVLTEAGAASSKRYGLSPYAAPGTTEFFQELASTQMANPLSVSILNLNGSMLACAIGYTHLDKFYLTLTSSEKSDVGQAAGRLLSEQLIRSSIAQGMKGFEFLSGTSPFREWDDGSYKLHERFEAITGRGRRTIGLTKVGRALRGLVGMSRERRSTPGQFSFVKRDDPKPESVDN